MKIGIITGASSGLGREYARRAFEEFTLDELWLVARREGASGFLLIMRVLASWGTLKPLRRQTTAQCAT